jgi:hypothetical protein
MQFMIKPWTRTFQDHSFTVYIRCFLQNAELFRRHREEKIKMYFVNGTNFSLPHLVKLCNSQMKY